MKYFNLISSGETIFNSNSLAMIFANLSAENDLDGNLEFLSELSNISSPSHNITLPSSSPGRSICITGVFVSFKCFE